MTPRADPHVQRIPLSKSQQNIYNGVLQDSDSSLYLVGRSYRFRPLELSAFLAALEGAILKNPVQLCVLDAPPTEADYPDLLPRLQFGDIVRVRSGGEPHTDRDDDELTRTWESDIFAKPLVRYNVWTDARGHVSGLDAHTHHILLDGGATGLIEADLARGLGAGAAAEQLCVSDGLTKVADAHRRETSRAEETLQRVARAVQRELADEARHCAYGQSSNDAPGTAAKGVLQESVRIADTAYDAILALSEAQQVPLNVLIAAAAVAVDASQRQSTESLLVHAVDNRFGDPDLNVATCLVNSVAHSVRFPPFASVEDLVRTVDRGYVKAVRRRWLREEQYRRMYLAINRTSHVEALTLNFLREPCAPELRPYLSEAPVTTDIGPVESMTVACILDEEQPALNLSIWNRADLPDNNTRPRVAERIAAVLESMAPMWHNPIAMTVNEWFGIGPDGARCQDNSATRTTQPPAAAWFLDPAGAVQKTLSGRRCVNQWIDWLLRNGAQPGDVVVLTDDNTDKTIDLLIACHLAGCGYSVCDTVDEVRPRAASIAEHGGGASAHVVDVAAARLEVVLDGKLRERIDGRIDQVRQDTLLATKTAYIMPTSGSTGLPKLVRVAHGSLALFCDAIRHAYGWGTHDTVLQCAPLTSDISVEELFGSAICGAELVRSTAMRTGDLGALAQDLVAKRPTIIDLPSAVWHLLCDDGDALDAIRRSRLRQIVIGGEAVRPSAVDKWIDSDVSQGISLISTYGPTETTVVVTYLPILSDGTIVEGGARLRVGRPIVPNTVFIAFGEVVVVGDLVACGYLGIDGRGFGTVTATNGSRQRAFATADRVIIDDDGFPVFSGRKDAIVKISGKRVDTAEVTRRISEDPAISDAAVELHDGGLGVWFETQQTREGGEHTVAAARIRHILVSLRVSSFFVLGVPSIPRKPNGKIDSDNLRAMPQFVDAAREDAGSGEKAAGLAAIWSRHLGRAIGPESSLLGEGIGSLDLIRILPDSRGYLGRHLSVLDLISADTAANLVFNLGGAATATGAWMDVETAAEIEHDLAWLRRPHPELLLRQPPNGFVEQRGDQAIVVVGASGILGTGFAEAVLDLRRSGLRCPQVVLATRSQLPDRGPWAALHRLGGVRFEQLSPEFGAAELDALIRDAGARTLVNCIGNTSVLVPYRELRLANVELVSTMAEACASRGTRFVHLSTFVVNGDVTAPRVTDPRDAPYPYAASKSLAELIVAGAPDALDFTIVRLPRILGEDYQLADSADILVSVVDACIALRAYPSLTLTEEVTTGRAAAKAILGLLPELAGPAVLGRGVTVVHGEALAYSEFLSGYALDEVDPSAWKHQLDQSDWAKRNPRRWSVVDAWITLGMKLDARSYAEYLSDYPTIAIGVETVAELVAIPQSIRALVAHGCFPALKHAGR